MRSTSSPRILIVDDEPNIRLMLRTALGSEGYQLEEAADGRAGLTAVERLKPDVMILDLSMPVLDGIAVLEAMKSLEAERRPRVIVLTAYGSIATAVRATRLGAIDFLEKPISPNELRAAVDDALNGPVVPPAGHPAAEDGSTGGYEAVLDRVRKSLRLSKIADAEMLLMRAADLGNHDAPYFNLIGVLYEIRRDWKLARKFYGKAIHADRSYAPAQQNMRRIYELTTFGQARDPVALGDETALDLVQAEVKRKRPG